MINKRWYDISNGESDNKIIQIIVQKQTKILTAEQQKW